MVKTFQSADIYSTGMTAAALAALQFIAKPADVTTEMIAHGCKQLYIIAYHCRFCKQMQQHSCIDF